MSSSYNNVFYRNGMCVVKFYGFMVNSFDRKYRCVPQVYVAN